MAGAAAVGSTAAGRVAADHDTSVPGHVTITDPMDELEYYRPLLDLNTQTVEVNPTTIYGWKAASSEHSTDVYVYVTYYTHQEGITTWDSHIYDREPVYVFVDESSGNITKCLYSGYHWLKAETRTPPIFKDSTGEHPAFMVAEKWHHYLVDEKKSGYLESVDSLGNEDQLQLDGVNTKFEEFLDNGWEEDLLKGVVVNPWKMESPDVESWWASDREEILRQIYVSVSRIPFVDIQGASTTDL